MNFGKNIKLTSTLTSILCKSFRTTLKCIISQETSLLFSRSATKRCERNNETIARLIFQLWWNRDKGGGFGLLVWKLQLRFHIRAIELRGWKKENGQTSKFGFGFCCVSLPLWEEGLFKSTLTQKQRNKIVTVRKMVPSRFPDFGQSNWK